MIELRPQPTLLDFLLVCSKLPDDEKRQIESFTGCAYSIDKSANANYNACGPRWGLYDGDQAIAIGGFQPIYKGVYRDWLLSTPAVWGEHWFAATRRFRRLMDEILRHPDVRVLECYSLSSRTAAHRWYRTLGYEYEATLKGRTASGDDVTIFSRVK